mmetsp:Transcript_101534/g.316609  ORF Transcript_101534/g.316609 Transcript_101534/m.316609 type:complete len:257 (-) Transcript_101534:228-998(-)
MLPTAFSRAMASENMPSRCAARPNSFRHLAVARIFRSALGGSQACHVKYLMIEPASLKRPSCSSTVSSVSHASLRASSRTNPRSLRGSCRTRLSLDTPQKAATCSVGILQNWSVKPPFGRQYPPSCRALSLASAASCSNSLACSLNSRPNAVPSSREFRKMWDSKGVVAVPPNSGSSTERSKVFAMRAARASPSSMMNWTFSNVTGSTKGVTAVMKALRIQGASMMKAWPSLSGYWSCRTPITALATLSGMRLLRP